jgi:hypothetical protein
MSTIEGVRREEREFSKKVGLFPAKVIAINPTEDEYSELLGWELKEGSKETDYLGEDEEGNTRLRINVWLEDIKSGTKFNASFFLKNKERENKDFTKKQWINAVGKCTWVTDINETRKLDKYKWFTKHEHRVAFVGEEELYNFVHKWLSGLDFNNTATDLHIDDNWKKFMKGSVKPLRDEIEGEWCRDPKTGDVIPFVALATIHTKQGEDGEEPKTFQNVYTKDFLYIDTLPHFRLVDYMKDAEYERLKAKKSLKDHERFVLDIRGEYGSKDYYLLKDIQDYNPEDNLVASDKTISEEGDDY